MARPRGPSVRRTDQSAAPKKREGRQSGDLLPCLWPHRIKASPDRLGGHGGSSVRQITNAAFGRRFLPARRIFREFRAIPPVAPNDDAGEAAGVGKLRKRRRYC